MSAAEGREKRGERREKRGAALTEDAYCHTMPTDFYPKSKEMLSIRFCWNTQYLIKATEASTCLLGGEHEK
jgi:hypothetical protein